jgi:uncharacterized protein (DUF433 family)
VDHAGRDGHTEALEGGDVTDLLDDQLVGVSARRAASIAEITVARLRRWEDYELVGPSTSREIGGKTVRLYGFQQLVELLVVRELERITNDVRKLRRVMNDLRHEYASPWTELRWAYDGGELFWQHPDGSWAGDRDPGQTVLHGVIELTLIEARVRQSVRRHASTVGRIERRRGVLASKQVIAGTRTPVDAVREYIEAGFEDAEILRAYPHLEAEDIAAVRAS